MTWRDCCIPIIREILAKHAGENESAIRDALREAYPFGQRIHHPYKVWLDEIQRQRGIKPPLGTFGPRTKAKAEPDPRQADLFNEDVQ